MVTYIDKWFIRDITTKKTTSSNSGGGGSGIGGSHDSHEIPDLDSSVVKRFEDIYLRALLYLVVAFGVTAIYLTYGGPQA